MATLFSRIIAGELPGNFVWRDDECVAFLSIAPLRPGHALIVPVAEVDKWTDLAPDLAAHLMVVAQRIGRAQETAFHPLRIGLIIAGLEVPHCHLHAVPIDSETDLHFGNADSNVTDEQLDAAATALRRALADAGYAAESRV
ncbi:MAG TPA: HIT family protein [Acidimicrobiales bacterium]|jgi:histidine triad (HIT) family protein|nr:HIT family protein [Acidimicrobiales bacterium]